MTLHRADRIVVVVVQSICFLRFPATVGDQMPLYPLGSVHGYHLRLFVLHLPHPRTPHTLQRFTPY
jgi:hypothetical protein